MNKENYLLLRKKNLHHLKPNNIKALIIILLCSSFFLFCIKLSLSENSLIWLLSQILLGVSILQFFFLSHDLGHYNFFSSKKVNIIFGHLSGLICMLPYHPWAYIHKTHHEWTGWREKDPTLPRIKETDLKPFQKNIINFCWRFYIPIFTTIFSIGNFWNYFKLKRLFKDKKIHQDNVFSLVFIFTVYALILFYFGPALVLKSYSLGLLIFLILSDPLLMSQHSGIEQMSVKGVQKLKPLPYYLQEEYTRSLNFPFFISDYILFGFNQHSLHHLFPKIPSYNLIKIKEKTSINLNWIDWMKETKNINATDFIFKVNEKTKVHKNVESHLNRLS